MQLPVRHRYVYYSQLTQAQVMAEDGSETEAKGRGGFVYA